jgi:malonate-semialdehyde dehydrogenase (acetylating)/methylmalonate-semialdehyde dehydrogenase
MLKYQELLK